MSQDYFHFKQFSVFQGNSSMKIGSDSVILGAWINPQNAIRILDIGTGMGLLALMIAQKSDAIIDAVEIDENSAKDARENFYNSSWKSRLNLYHIDFLKYVEEISERYNIIISNPPYFNNSLKSPVQSRNIARHTDSLNYNDLLTGVSKLLNDTGKFCTIIPYNNSKDFKEIALLKGLFCRRQTIVKSKTNSPPIRMLIEFSKEIRLTPEFSELSIRNEAGNYTEHFKDLTASYYL